MLKSQKNWGQYLTFRVLKCIGSEILGFWGSSMIKSCLEANFIFKIKSNRNQPFFCPGLIFFYSSRDFLTMTKNLWKMIFKCQKMIKVAKWCQAQTSSKSSPLSSSKYVDKNIEKMPKHVNNQKLIKGPKLANRRLLFVLCPLCLKFDIMITLLSVNDVVNCGIVDDDEEHL